MTENIETMPDEQQRHRARKQQHKEIVDARIASATQQRGVILVHTGNGKGKSSSAFGMMARALGHNMRVGVVQFIKGSFPPVKKPSSGVFPKSNIT